MTRRRELAAVVVLLLVLVGLALSLVPSDPVNRIRPGMTVDEVMSLLKGAGYGWEGRGDASPLGEAHFMWWRGDGWEGKSVVVTFGLDGHTTGEVKVFTWPSQSERFWSLFGYPLPEHRW